MAIFLQTFESAPIMSILGSVTDATNLDNCRSVAVNSTGGHAMVGCGNPNNRVTAVNYSTPTNPYVWDSVQSGTTLLNAYGVAYASGEVFVAAFSADRAVHVTATTIPGMSITGSVYDFPDLNGVASVVKDGVYGYFKAGSAITSVTFLTPSSPSVVDSYSNTTELSSSSPNSATICQIPGGNLLVAAGSGGTYGRLTSVDISTPSSLSVLDSEEQYTSATYGYGDYVIAEFHAGDYYAYVGGGFLVGGPGFITCWDVSTDTALSRIAELELPDDDGVSGITFYGSKYVLVCCRDSDSVVAIDVSTPSSPVIAARLVDTLLSGAVAIAADDNDDVAVVTCAAEDRVTIVDLSGLP